MDRGKLFTSTVLTQLAWIVCLALTVLSVSHGVDKADAAILTLTYFTSGLFVLPIFILHEPPAADAPIAAKAALIEEPVGSLPYATPDANRTHIAEPEIWDTALASRVANRKRTAILLALALIPAFYFSASHFHFRAPSRIEGATANLQKWAAVASALFMSANLLGIAFAQRSRFIRDRGILVGAAVVFLVTSSGIGGSREYSPIAFAGLTQILAAVVLIVARSKEQRCVRTNDAVTIRARVMIQELRKLLREMLFIFALVSPLSVVLIMINRKDGWEGIHNLRFSLLLWLIITSIGKCLAVLELPKLRFKEVILVTCSAMAGAAIAYFTHSIGGWIALHAMICAYLVSRGPVLRLRLLAPQQNE